MRSLQLPPLNIKHKAFAALAAGLTALSQLASAATLPPITLTWNQNPEPDIAGYELSYGTAAGSYGTKIDVGLNTSTAVSGLTAGVKYYFVVVAYNTAQLRSEPSAEISYTGTLTNQAPNSTISAPSSNQTITTGQSISFSGNGSDPDGDTSLSYLWNFGSGSGITNSTSQNAGSKQFNNPGTFVVTYTVTDSNGLADPTPAQRTITVNSSPTSDGVPDGWISTPASDEIIVAGQNVSFEGGGIDSNGNESVRYLWNFGNGTGVPDSSVSKPVKRCFETPGTYTVTLTVLDSKGVADPSPATRKITVLSPNKLVSRSGWKLHFVDSQETGGYEATRAFDGNAGTIWHTQWKTEQPPPPHEIQIDMGAVREVTGFRYLPRNDGYTVGNIDKYRFYVSMDGVTWGRHVASGRFPATVGEKEILFPARSARFVRLVSLGDVNGGPECSVAELNVLESQ